MAYTEKFMVKGKEYFRLVEKVKGDDGKWRRHIVRYIGNEKAHNKYLKAAVETGNLGKYLEQEMLKQPELSRMALSGIRSSIRRALRRRVPSLTVACVGEKLAILPRSMTKWVTEKMADDLPDGKHGVADASNSVFLGTAVQTGIGTAVVVCIPLSAKLPSGWLCGRRRPSSAMAYVTSG